MENGNQISIVHVWLFENLYFFLSADKPEVKIVVEFPQGLTREGENLELTCKTKGKPEWEGFHSFTISINPNDMLYMSV